MKSIKQIIAAGITGLALLVGAAGCYESSWEEIYDCDAEFQAYIDDTISVVDKYSSDIITEIEALTSEEERKVSPNYVLDLMISGDVDIKCGIPAEIDEPKPVGSWTTENGKKYVVIDETWHIENFSLFEKYQNTLYLLDDNFDLDKSIVEEEMLNDPQGIEHGYDIALGQVWDLYLSFGSLGNLLVHEFTHGAWDLNGFDSTHEEGVSPFNPDAFWHYGNGTSIAINNVRENYIDPQIDQIYEKLLDE